MRRIVLTMMFIMGLQTALGQDFVRVENGQFIRHGQPYHYVGTNFWYGAVLGSKGQGGDRERLAKELDFIEHFISLMRLRYPEESVRIDTVFPEVSSGAVVPPLVMASFVENAFKHGVSYSSSSFIRIKVDMQDGKVVFRCSNSYHPSENDSRHGIGLENIRKRLTLLYGPSYALSIDDTDDRYDVVLSIPAQPDQNLS